MSIATKEQIVTRVQNKYSWVSASDIERCYNFALSDYLLYKYPSDNNRPSETELQLTFIVEQWVEQRMLDILDRAGGGVIGYSENGINWEYAASNIDPSLINRIMPKAATPR